MSFFTNKEHLDADESDRFNPACVPSTLDVGSSELSQWIEYDPDKHGGCVVFVGTRVPVENLFRYLVDGASLNEILEAFPSMPNEAAIAILNESMKAVMNDAITRYRASAPNLQSF